MSIGGFNDSHPTRTNGEVRWAWVYGALVGGLVVFGVMRWIA